MKNDDVLEKLINARADLPRAERTKNRRNYRQKVADGLLATGSQIGKSATMSMAEYHRLAAAHTAGALQTIAQIMLTGEPKLRLLAADLLIKCAWGNPVTPIEHGGTVNVTSGARERLLAVLERVGEPDVKALSLAEKIVDVEAVSVVPAEPVPKAVVKELSKKPETVRDLITYKVLTPPARKPGDE